MSSTMAEFLIYSLPNLALSLAIIGPVYWSFVTIRWTWRAFTAGPRQVTSYLGTSVYLTED